MKIEGWYIWTHIVPPRRHREQGILVQVYSNQKFETTYKVTKVYEFSEDYNGILGKYLHYTSELTSEDKSVSSVGRRGQPDETGDKST